MIFSPPTIRPHWPKWRCCPPLCFCVTWGCCSISSRAEAMRRSKFNLWQSQPDRLPRREQKSFHGIKFCARLVGMNFIQFARAGVLCLALASSSSGKTGDATQDGGAIKESHQTLSLNGAWTVTAMPLEAEGESGYATFTQTNAERLPAQVPGEVHLDLMRLGRMPDPDISDNARERCRWP